MDISCFKAYAIRGKLGDEINEEITYRIGRAYAEHLKPRKVAGLRVNEIEKLLCE